jgi:hypothetical protein
VSDFLSRLAARAVREPPRASPSLPSATEAAAVSRGVAPAPAKEPPVAQATPAAPAVRSEAPESRFESEHAPLERPPTRTPPARMVERSAVPAAASQPPPAAAEPREPEVTQTPSVPVAAAAPVVAAPIVRRVVESRVERLHTVSTTVAADEPPVRVHIGRLEVRANLEQPAAGPERREPQRQQGPTLSDYLRGRRGA